MKFTVEKQKLLLELDLLLGVVEEDATIPVLRCVKIAAADKDSVSIAGTDLDTSLTTNCVAIVQEIGACVLPARKLHEIVAAMPGPLVVFADQPNNDLVMIRSGCANFELLGMEPERFPSIPHVSIGAQAGELITSISSCLLSSVLKQAIYASIEEDSRYALNAVLLRINEGVLKVVACDGHRLAIASKEMQTRVADNTQALIPRKTSFQLAALTAARSNEISDISDQALADLNGDVRFGQDDRHVFFEVGHRTLSSNKSAGTFPDYERVIPQHNSIIITLNTAELSQAIARAALIADERSQRVQLNLSDGYLTVSAYHDDFGKSEEAIACCYGYEGEPVKMVVHADYLIEFLNTITDERVTVAIKPGNDGSSPIVMKPESDSNYTYIVMQQK